MFVLVESKGAERVKPPLQCSTEMTIYHNNAQQETAKTLITMSGVLVQFGWEFCYIPGMKSGVFLLDVGLCQSYTFWLIVFVMIELLDAASGRTPSGMMEAWWNLSLFADDLIVLAAWTWDSQLSVKQLGWDSEPSHEAMVWLLKMWTAPFRFKWRGISGSSS